MNAFAALVKEGRTHDYEDSRTTHRMQATIDLLEDLGIERTVTHNDSTYFDWATRRERHECSHYPSCKVTWSEWATDEMFDKAWDLVNLTLSERGRYNRTRPHSVDRG